MGRATTRQLKRAREAGQDFEEARHQALQEGIMRAKPDSELFFVDTTR
jgi:hypothetical protein